MHGRITVRIKSKCSVMDIHKCVSSLRWGFTVPEMLTQESFPSGLQRRHTFPVSDNVKWHWGSQPCHDSVLSGSKTLFLPTLDLPSASSQPPEELYAGKKYPILSSPSPRQWAPEYCSWRCYPWLRHSLGLSSGYHKCSHPHALLVPFLLRCSLHHH